MNNNYKEIVTKAVIGKSKNKYRRIQYLARRKYK